MHTNAFYGDVHLLGEDPYLYQFQGILGIKKKKKGLIPAAIHFNHLPVLTQFGSQTPAATGARTSDRDPYPPQAPTASCGLRTLLLELKLFSFFKEPVMPPRVFPDHLI